MVRGGVEPPTFRFSGGLAGPGESIAGWLTGPSGALALLRVQARPHLSTAVVSTALARSAGDQEGAPEKPAADYQLGKERTGWPLPAHTQVGSPGGLSVSTREAWLLTDPSGT